MQDANTRVRVPVIMGSSVTRRAAVIGTCFFFLFSLSSNRPSFLFELFRERSLVAREDEFPRVQIVVKLTVPVKMDVNLTYARGTSELTIREFLYLVLYFVYGIGF